MNLINDEELGFRTESLQTRLDIGFPELHKSWGDEKAIYDEHSLFIGGHPVMEDWENPYMKELADIICVNGGKILEVGFGMGISSCHIQAHEIDEHYIIEANKQVYEKSLLFQKKWGMSKVFPLFGFWEDVVLTLEDESFDGILFDTYPLEEELIHCNHYPFFKDAYRLLKKGGIFTYYSDEIESYSPSHLKYLKMAGWKNIQSKVCEVSPPDDCQYWKSKTILTPILIK
jgi:guanidinoacetate N-methyltransferase